MLLEIYGVYLPSYNMCKVWVCELSFNHLPREVEEENSDDWNIVYIWKSCDLSSQTNKHMPRTLNEFLFIEYDWIKLNIIEYN